MRGIEIIRAAEQVAEAQQYLRGNTVARGNGLVTPGWLLNLGVLTGTGETLGTVLDWWEVSQTRQAAHSTLRLAAIDPDLVILSPDAARREGLTSTLAFPTGNLAPQGSVVKATAIDPGVIGEDGVYRCRGRARVFTSEHDPIRAIKGLSQPPIQPGDVLVYTGGGPLGAGMEETYELTSALKYLPWGKHVPLLTDARFSGVSTGACLGHIGPEALAGGPVGRLRDGDLIEIGQFSCFGRGWCCELLEKERTLGAQAYYLSESGS